MTFRYQPFPVAPLPPGLCAATVHFLTLVHHSPQHQAVNDPKVLFTTEVIPKRECDGRAAASLQLRILCLGVLQRGNVGVGILPKGDEILIDSVCLEDLTLHGRDPTQRGVSLAASASPLVRSADE